MNSPIPRIAPALVLVLGLAGCDGDDTSADIAPEIVRPPTMAAGAFAPVDPANIPAEGAETDWPTYGGAFANQRYSRLDQINGENVHRLSLAWIHQTGAPGPFETTPLAAGGRLYLSTLQSGVVALDGATGRELWRYTPELREVALCCGGQSRGVALSGRSVYLATLDARLIALDAESGAVAFDVEIADPSAGYSVVMAPLALPGRIIVGTSGGKYGVRGFLAAYDPGSGQELWRWYAVPAADSVRGWWGEWRDTDPFGTSLGRDIAQERADSGRFSAGWNVGGGSILGTPAYDPESGTLYANIGSPAPALDGTIRPGDNLYTGAIVALDVETGSLLWHFQYLPHDVWDLAGGSQPFLFQTAQGPHLAVAGKTGWLYVVDARSGEPRLRSENFVPQDNLFTPAADQAVLLAPGANGGATAPAAYSPDTDLAYVLARHQPMVYTRSPEGYRRGRLWLGGRARVPPDADPWGTVAAIDIATGALRWQKQTPDASTAAPLVTAGGLLFAGQGSGAFDAFDARTGDLLWQFQAGAPVSGGAATYIAGGTQYVVVPSGGTSQDVGAQGDDVFAFRLDTGARQAAPAYPAPRYRRHDAQMARTGVRQVTDEDPAPATPDSAAPDTAAGSS